MHIILLKFSYLRNNSRLNFTPNFIAASHFLFLYFVDKFVLRICFHCDSRLYFRELHSFEYSLSVSLSVTRNFEQTDKVRYVQICYRRYVVWNSLCVGLVRRK